MKNTQPLSLVEKIKLIRKAKGLSLENLAHAASVNISTISRIENGAMQYNDKMLDAIVKYMKIENAPFAEQEVEAYKGRLWVINDLITAERVAEARAAQNDLFPVTELPYEHDLSLLYTMTDVRILFKEGNIPAAEEKLKAADVFLDGASNEALILYHRNRGFSHQYSGDIVNSLKQYLLVADIESTILPNDANIYYNIGILYVYHNKPVLAASYLERAQQMYNYGRTHVAGPTIDMLLAHCYQVMAQYSKSKKLLHKSLASAKSIGDALSIGASSVSLGSVYGMDGDLQTGVDLISQGLEYLKDSNEHYLQGLYAKTGFLITMKKYNEAKEAIELGKSLSKDGDMSAIAKPLSNDGDMFAIGFEALECVLSLQSSKKDNAAAEYIGNVAIPYLRNISLSRHMALWLCDVLEAYYNKHRSTKMAMATAVVTRDIYKEMFFGDVE